MATSTRPKKLAEYQAKRDFSRTPEPSGKGRAPRGGSRFVVQRHRARRLHYDLRLELDGVLVSWAVPKGPTLDPKSRRLAVQVEDHPLSYYDFEGVIPDGYGKGDVIVWDWGTWAPAEGTDPVAALKKGDLHFDLDGEKLKGRFVLVRRDKPGGKDDWLLLHKRDDAAVAGWDPEEHPQSVKSGRTNAEVAGKAKSKPKSRPKATKSTAKATKATKATTRRRVRGGRAKPSRWKAPTGDELAALDALGKGGEWEFQGRTLKLTNLDKVLFPARQGEEVVTKRDLIRYAAQIAPAMLPYLDGRPVNMHRYPNGAEKPGFWHKAAPAHTPEWITQWRNEDADPGETECYLVMDSPPALVWVANYGALELHPWTSTAGDPHAPTWALIDLDPGEKTTWDDLVVFAQLHRTALDHLGVEARPKVTGKRGIQIWVPVTAGAYTFDDTRAWVEKLSRTIGKLVDDKVSWAWEKKQRKGLARLDYTQNAINKTLVAPWSTRPAAGAPVSVPIEWDELDDPDLRPDRWTVRTALDRIAAHGDPLLPLVGLRQDLPEL
ncbi:MAG TPA: DNA polymerase ligase N-terminal domain-containing protein [Acidimicrobiia bacterium]|nr:DNA polymerase ligase N-terminal domain-containing protein [Acidimicrobiia bacterium]